MTLEKAISRRLRPEQAAQFAHVVDALYVPDGIYEFARALFADHGCAQQETFLFDFVARHRVLGSTAYVRRVMAQHAAIAQREFDDTLASGQRAVQFGIAVGANAAKRLRSPENASSTAVMPNATMVAAAAPLRAGMPPASAAFTTEGMMREPGTHASRVPPCVLM